MYNFFAPDFLTNTVSAEFCSIMEPICNFFLELFVDMDASVDDMDRAMTYFTHIPAGAGYKNFIHYG